MSGRPESPVLIVAMSPGRDELKQDTPLIGGSGKLLWAAVQKRMGITRADCYIINTIGEWPDKADGNPSKEQLERWWDQFNDAIALSSAKLCICLGGVALTRVMGEIDHDSKGRPKPPGIENWRGYLLTRKDQRPVTRSKVVFGTYKTANKAKGRKAGDPKAEIVKVHETCPLPETVEWIIPTLHPAAVLRSGFGSYPAFAADIERCGRALKGELRPYRTEFTNVPLYLDGGTPIAFDIETPMPGVEGAAIERIGIAGAHRTWSAPWDYAAAEMARSAVAGATVRVAHNIGFDAPRLADAGCPIPEPWWDTMYANLMLYPDLYKGLNSVASLHLDCPRWKHLNDDQPAFYNARDASATLELYPILREKLRQTGQLEFFEQKVMRTLPVLVEMQREGIKLDQSRRADWLVQLGKQLGESQAQWSEVAGGVSYASPKQLGEFLYGTLGLPVQYSKYGGMTTDAAALKTLLSLPRVGGRERTVLEVLLKLRETTKMLGTYGGLEAEADGRIHPAWMPAGKDAESFNKGLAGTWRITSSGPNFQNVPPAARNLYIPDHPEWSFIAGDWSQIEARIIAVLSGDPNLQAAIISGLHARNMAILGVDKTRAKNAFYGWCYGAGKRTLHRTFVAHGYDIPEHECAAMLSRLDAEFHVAAAWRRELLEQVNETRRISNPFGLHRFFFKGAEDAPAIFDFIPQSTAAGCMWTVVRPLADALRPLGWRVTLLIHDDITIQGPDETLKEAAAIHKQHMEQTFNCIKPRFFVPIEQKVGKNWGELVPLG